MICAVSLARGAETLTRRASHNRIDLACTDQFCQTRGSKFGQVFFQGSPLFSVELEYELDRLRG